MNIEDYAWGKITIGGKTYMSDVIVYPDRVDASWWRKEGHNLHVDDLKDVIAARPECLVVGVGALGAMKVPKETIAHLESMGIRVYVEKTGKAVDLYQQLKKERTVVAALHLTC